MLSFVKTARSWVVLMFAVALSAGVSGQSAEELEALLREKQDAVFSIQARFRTHSEVLHELDSFTAGTVSIPLSERELIMESGRFFSSWTFPMAEAGSPQTQTMKDSWNGALRFNSTLAADGKMRNNIHGDFSLGNGLDSANFLADAGINPHLVLGSFDAASPEAIGRIQTPLDVFNRIRHTGPKQEESLRIDRVTEDGRDLLRLGLYYSPGDTKIVEHWLDPSMNFACVETKTFDPSGALLTDLTRVFEPGVDGIPRIKSMRRAQTVRNLAWVAGKIEELGDPRHKGIGSAYSEADYDQIGMVTFIDFDRVEINQPIDPRVYEEGNVFYVEAETWDERTKTQIQPSLEEIQQSTLASIVRELDDDSGGTRPTGGIPDREANGPDTERATEAGVERPRYLGYILGSAGLGMAVLGCWLWFRHRKRSGVERGAFLLVALAASSVLAEQPVEKSVTVEFGVVLAGQENAEVEYKFGNSSPAPMRIEEVKTSCGCTTFSYPEVIGPNSEGSFKFTVTPRNVVGLIETTVYVRFEGLDSPLLIKLKGYKQEASLTQQVVFAGVEKHNNPRGGSESHSRILSLRMFDVADPATLSMENWTYDKDRFEITPSTYDENDYAVVVDGRQWYYIERAFRLKLRPQNLERGRFAEKLLFQHPLQAPTGPIAGEEIRASVVAPGDRQDQGNFRLSVDVTGEILADIFTKPASLNFLFDGNSGSGETTKHFSVFNESGGSYRLEYDSNQFSVTGADDRFEMRIIPERLQEILREKAGRVSLGFVTIYGGSPDRVFRVPVTASVY